MASLQQSFIYEGNPANAPYRTVQLNLEIPTFEFISTQVYRKPRLERIDVGIESLVVFQDLLDDDYFLNVPTDFLIGGTTSNALNFWKYLNQLGFASTDPDLLSSLSLLYNIDIKDEKGNLLGNLKQSALFSLATSSVKYKKLIDLHKELLSTSTINDEKIAQLETEIAKYIEENVFLLNNKSFKEVAAQFAEIMPNLNEYALLYLISHFTNLTDGKPGINIDGEEIKVFLKAHFDIDKAPIIRAIIKLLKESATKLFDFIVTVPEIKTTSIKGTFKIIPSDGSIVSLSDFNFYDLAIEYAISSGENESIPMSVNYDWNTVANSDLVDNAVPFAFFPIIVNALDSLIFVRVKGYDGSIVWEEEFAATDPNLEKLVIEVSLLKPFVFSGSDEPQTTSGNKKLHGKVVEMTGKCELKALTVVIQTKKTNDTIWKIVGTATTDSSGNFSLPYPYGVYTAAQALVSLTPNSPADIVVLTDSAHVLLNETISEDFLYLLLKDVVCEPKSKEDDCDCHEPKKSNRLPDQEELIKSDDYTQDIGGACINLSTPNRTLSEYSHRAIVRTSDPDVANYTLTKDEKGTFRLKGGETKINRKKVDLSNAIRWQDAPDNKDNLSLYQAVTVATGHILHYKIVMKADGYSMGELLYSLPLAPGQKKQIVMFEQTHTLQGSETQRISQSESLAASLLNERNITDTLGGSINENISGSSSANTSGISAGLGLAGIINGIAGTLGVAGGIANSNSSASQNSSRTVAQQFQEQFKNGIVQNAQSYRELNASVITTVSEGQQYGVTSEVVANHNHCHSLTMMYFEVLRHYAIYQELSQVEECLFIPLLMTEFSRENIYKWRDVLANNLLPIPSDTYLQPFVRIKIGRQHPLLKAFDAIERIKTDYRDVDFPEGAFCDEPITSLSGYLSLQINIPRPKTIFDRILSFPIVKRETITNTNGGGIWGSIVDAVVGENNVSKPWEEKLKIANEHIIIYDNFQEAKPADVIEVVKFDNFFPSTSNDGKVWTVIASLCGYSNVENFLANYFANKTISKWDQVFNDEIAPKVFEELVRNSITINPFSQIDFTTTSKYHGGNVLMRLNLQANTSLARKNINQIKFVYTKSIAYPNAFWTFVTFNIQNINIGYTTKHYFGLIINRFLGADLYDGTPDLSTLMNSDEQRNPKKEDQYLAIKLIEHLNSNIEYYNKVLWRNLDQDRRYMLFDGFKIETYDDYGQPNGYRSLASVIKNELIGIAGNSLIMPVAPGYKIDRSYIVAPSIEGPEEKIDLFEHYKPLTPAPPYRISIPSKGVFAEAVQGACDACEKVKENTSQDWEKFKTDEPTPINAVTTPVPVVTDWKAAFKDFATPIVNIQNAPAAPAPGAGLAGLSDLLGKSDSFRDITGLEGNQKNAMQTYLSNQQNAKDFAQMAKDIFTMDNNTKHSDAIAESIRNSDELSDQDKAELLKKHFNQVIDGGQSEKAAKEAAAKNSEPTAMGIAADAENKGKPIKVATSDASGNTQSLEVGSGSSTKNKRVTGTTYWVSQGEKTNACWAAAATMMKSWKDHKKYSIEDVLALTPPEYLAKYNADELLLVAEKNEFIAALAMVSEPPASYTFDTYIGWLEQYGPLWITIDSNTSTDRISPHAIVLIGYDGDGTESNSQFVFYDPLKSGEQKETFADFDTKYGQMASENPGTLMTQIVHFKDEILGEGAGTSDAIITQRWTDLKNLAITTCEKKIIDEIITNQPWIKVKYFQKDKPIDHQGYLVGMSLIYARLYCLLSKNERYTLQISKIAVPDDPDNDIFDALNQYDPEFSGLGITDSSEGKATLRKVFTLLFGLGMQESEGEFGCGVNLDAGETLATKTAAQAEAGIFQVSTFIGINNTIEANYKDVHELYLLYQQLQTQGSMLQVFKIGKNRRLNPTPHLATNPAENLNTAGAKFQKLIFSNPAFSVVLAALGIRFRRKHWGPLDDAKEAKIKKECYDMFMTIEGIVDANTCCSESGFVRTTYDLIPSSSISVQPIDMSVGTNTFFIVGKRGEEFEIIKYDKTLWTSSVVGIGFMKVVVDKNDIVWGIDKVGNIFYWEDNVFKQKSSESASDISIGTDGSIWILDVNLIDNKGFRIKKFDASTNSWVQHDDTGLATKIYFSDNNTLWALNKLGEIWFYTSSVWSKLDLPFKVIDFAIGPNNVVWVIDNVATNGSNCSIYMYNSRDLIKYDGAAVKIEIDNVTGLPFIIKDNGDIYKMLNIA